jgi:hypothetical protein
MTGQEACPTRAYWHYRQIGRRRYSVTCHYAISPRVALEPAKIAYGADISIRENRLLTKKGFA